MPKNNMRRQANNKGRRHRHDSQPRPEAASRSRILRFTPIFARPVHLQHRQPLVQALRALRLHHPQAPVHRRKERRRIVGNPRIRQLRQRIGLRAQHLPLSARRVHWRPPGHGPAAQGGERVDVRPRPLRALAGVLLRRRVAGGRDDRHASRLVAHGLPRRPEVQQHGGFVRPADVDVGGLDVPVQEPRRVDLAQTVRYGQHNPPKLPLREGSAPRQQDVQRQAVLVVHDEVGGVVRLEEVQRPDQIGMLELGQGAALLDEALQPPLKVRLAGCRLGLHRCAVAHGELVGQALLERHPPAQLQMLGQIGDAEAADAQHPEQAVAPDQVAGRQRLLVLLLPPFHHRHP